MNDAQRMESLLNHLKLSKHRLGVNIGSVNGMIINHVLTGRNRISEKLAASIVGTYPEVSYEWLLKGNGEMILPVFNSYKTSDAQAIIVSEDSEEYANRFGNVFTPLENGQYLMRVPIIQEYARGGRMADFSDREYFDELLKHSVIVDKIHRGKYLAFRVIGESMDFEGRDAILDGALVTGRELKQELWKNAKLHLNKYKDFIIAGADGICVKRIKSHDLENGLITCESLNPNKDKYPDFDLKMDGVDYLFNIIKVENPR